MTSLLNTIKKFVKQSGDHLLIFEDEEALWVVMTLAEYERLQSSQRNEDHTERFSEPPARLNEVSRSGGPAGVFSPAHRLPTGQAGLPASPARLDSESERAGRPAGVFSSEHRLPPPAGGEMGRNFGSWEGDDNGGSSVRLEDLPL